MRDNSNYGISLSSSSENFVLGSTCEDNGSDGIHLDGNYNIVYNNYCNSNDGDGIHIYDYSNFNSVSGCTCRYNDYYGLYLQNAYNNSVSGNTLTSNYEEGLYLNSSTDNTIAGNDISSNGWDNDYQCRIANASDDNVLFLNVFDYIDNPVTSSGSSNTWDSPVKLSYLYKGLTGDQKNT